MRYKKLVALCLLALIVACPRRGTSRKQESTVVTVGTVSSWEEITDQSLRSLWQVYPSRAAAMGISGYHNKLPSRRGGALKNAVDGLTAAVQRLYALRPEDLTADERVDRRLLIGALRLAIHEIAVEGRPLKAPNDDVEEAIDTVVAVWLNKEYPFEKRMDAIGQLLLQLPEFLSSSRDNLHQPSARLCAEAASRVALLRDFLVAELQPVSVQLALESREAFQLGVDEALHGIDAYTAGLKVSCAGAQDIVPIGEKNYVDRLYHAHSLEVSTQEVVTEAQAWHDRANQELARLAQPAQPGLLRAPPGFSRRAFLETIGTQVATLRSLVVEKQLATLSGGRSQLRVVQKPNLISDHIVSLGLRPAPAFGKGESLFVVGLLPAAEPTGLDADRYYSLLTSNALLLVIAAETFPGRQLQQLLSHRQPSSVRRAHRSSMLEDGWALYAAGLALDSQIVINNDMALRAYWEEIRAAAARAMVDVKLHTGVMSFAQGVQFLEQNTTLPGLAHNRGRAEWLQREVVKILSQPTRGAAALLGKIALEEMRDEARRRSRGPFDQQRFHDLVLTQGSIPIALIAHILFRDPLPKMRPFVDFSPTSP